MEYVICVQRSLRNNGLGLQRLIGLGTDEVLVVMASLLESWVKVKADLPHLTLATLHRLMLHATQIFSSKKYNWFFRSDEQAKVKELCGLRYDRLTPLMLEQRRPTRWIS